MEWLKNDIKQIADDIKSAGFECRPLLGDLSMWARIKFPPAGLK